MRNLLTISAALLFGASVLCAQEYSPYNPAGRWYVSVQGGPMYQSNENAFSYRYNHLGTKLITYNAGLSVGYNFDEIYGVRATVEYGLNRSACNTVQTASHGFYPYDFKSISAFADLVIDINGLNAIERAFSPKIYGGIGYGRSFGFSKPEGYGTERNHTWQAEEKFHPWQHIKETNNAFAFRFGAILEYDFTSGLGLFLDCSLEAYTDWFNGMEPPVSDDPGAGRGTGIAGFPFDLRTPVQLGVLFRF